MRHLFMDAFYFKHLTEGTPLFIFASFSNLPRQAEDTISKDIGISDTNKINLLR